MYSITYTIFMLYFYKSWCISTYFTVAPARQVRTGQVLRDGPAREGKAHADVSRMVGKGQLRTAQEEEAQKGAKRGGRKYKDLPNQCLSCHHYSCYQRV